MANRPRGFGMTSEIHRRIADKYDSNLEQETRLWMEAVLQEPLKPEADQDVALGQDQFQAVLRDGTKLCRLINTIQPGTVKKINPPKMAFLMMENIGNFLSGCEHLGCKKNDLFQTADLFDRANMYQVLNGINALGRRATLIGYEGPRLGPREANSNPRNFSKEKLNAGQTVIGLQMGSNKGASQRGMSFGRSRSINEHGQD